MITVIITLPITFVGSGAVLYKEKILQNIPNSKFSNNNDLSAYCLGQAGYKHFNDNRNEENDLLPLYIRSPKAQQLMEAKKNG